MLERELPEGYRLFYTQVLNNHGTGDPVGDFMGSISLQIPSSVNFPGNAAMKINPNLAWLMHTVGIERIFVNISPTQGGGELSEAESRDTPMESRHISNLFIAEDTYLTRRRVEAIIQKEGAGDINDPKLWERAINQKIAEKLIKAAKITSIKMNAKDRLLLPMKVILYLGLPFGDEFAKNIHHLGNYSGLQAIIFSLVLYASTQSFEFALNRLLSREERLKLGPQALRYLIFSSGLRNIKPISIE